GRGNLLSQTNPASKHRSMMAIESQEGAGDRKVVSIKGNRVTALEGGKGTEMGNLSSGMKTNLDVLSKQLDPLVERITELKKQIAGAPEEDKAERIEAINEQIRDLQKQRETQRNAAGRDIGKSIGERSVFG